MGAAGFAGLGSGALVGAAVGGGSGTSGAEAALSAARSRGGPLDGVPAALRTPTPCHVHLVALDLGESSGPEEVRSAARTALPVLSEEAREIQEHGPASRAQGSASAGLRPASLGVSLGLGSGLLRKAGLAERVPPALADLPAFTSDRLTPSWCGGDLLVHVGAEDALVVSSAIEHLLGVLDDDVRVRWSLPGFQRSAAVASDPADTPRNLMGQIDGTVNPEPDQTLFTSQVLASHTEPGFTWMAGGSYVVVRRIRMLLRDWSAIDLSSREAVIGRHLSNGAPLGGQEEGSRPDLAARNEDGSPMIPANAHIRLTSSENTLGARMLRRGFNFDLGWDSDGVRQAGLLFTAWQADPASGFIPVQRAMDEGEDALNPFIRQEGSALFAVPQVGGRQTWVGQELFGE
ncbi:Dyp-type peroxidase [Nocardiopsis sp. JB363]|uniref:Dyp-type peroxidase n=1 Tax=Nocardiopsis sp. JB363 TaxID=1434837 RepID=UPI000B35AB46|nr:Dyp-type peroxidase [Nocardiopsis sp. JB363]